ncbi:hypothetical protein ILUMI_19066 [Ignelater luminosus]|uniref:Uncharacterized protein n=1 Tax=Ignelater luminosus TaxID=2038154 RepID=A0A8K0CN20_IGNLU|nr:hypothetical protein ILUMI_19066 [Ignelater luminosus]
MESINRKIEKSDKRKKKINKKIKSYKLKEESFKKKYQEKIETTYNQRQEIKGVEERWSEFKNIILDVAKETCGFFQNDYHLTVERAEMSSYNKNYMKTASVVSFRYKRTLIALNMTLRFNIDVGSNLEAVIQLYKFSSNEYRLFPLRVGDKVCRAFDADVAGVKTCTRKCGNITQCLFSKDRTYHVCNVILDESKLPPHIPTGRYMAEVEVSYETIQLFVVKGYFAITRPEV